MALSPEIQAAIEKGLEQITDLNALQDALKTLDPNGQLQTRQEEDTSEEIQQEDTSNELKEEPDSDIAAEQSKDVKPISSDDKKSNSTPSLSELTTDKMSSNKNTNNKPEEEKRDKEREEMGRELTDRAVRDGMYDSNQSYAFLKDYFAQINEDYQGLINDK